MCNKNKAKEYYKINRDFILIDQQRINIRAIKK